MDVIPALLLARNDAAAEALVPRVHFEQRPSPEQAADVPYEFARAVVGDVRAPADPNAISAVDEHIGYDRAVPLGLDGQPLLVEVLEHGVVVNMEDCTCGRLQARVDVARGGVVLAALQSRAKLPGWHQQVQIVGPNKVLRKVDDGVLQRRLAVVVGRLLGDVPNKLGNLDVVLQLLLERAVDNLPLGGFEAIDHRGDRARDVVLGKLHELLVDEVRVADGALRVVHKGAVLVAVDPLLPVISPFLVERQVDGLAVVIAAPLEAHLVLLDVPEVLLRLLHRAGSQALVVLRLPALAVVRALLPLLVLVQREEGGLLASLGVLGASLPHLHDRRDEFLEEAVH
mmetsp:Transcript_32833/g.88944  ORF Transcript_32833/g.88944 Transcript_32833/m.88944 type:complete len:342 (-) Transcript_32833:813-1838(-)